MKSKIPLIICFITGMLIIIPFFISNGVSDDFRKTVEGFSIIIIAVSVILGSVNLVTRNIKKILQKKNDRFYSIVLVFAFFITVLIGLIFGIVVPEETKTTFGVLRGQWFTYIFDNVLIPLRATMFSLLAFFVASAAYRSFRARNKYAAVLLITASVVMLGRVPVGDYIFSKVFHGISSYITMTDITQWIMDIPNSAAQRGIKIAAGIGAVIAAIKVLLGIEKTYFGEK